MKIVSNYYSASCEKQMLVVMAAILGLLVPPAAAQNKDNSMHALAAVIAFTGSIAGLFILLSVAIYCCKQVGYRLAISNNNETKRLVEPRSANIQDAQSDSENDLKISSLM